MRCPAHSAALHPTGCSCAIYPKEDERPDIASRIVRAAEPGDMEAFSLGALAAVALLALLTLRHVAPAIAGWLFN